MWWDMLGVKLLFLDQVELAPEEKKSKSQKPTDGLKEYNCTVA